MAHDSSNPDRISGSTLSNLLRQMFDTVSGKPAPASLIDLVDQLDDTAPDAEMGDEPPSVARLVLVSA